jgi:ABC-type sugar transport system ATPase subunit
LKNIQKFLDMKDIQKGVVHRDTKNDSIHLKGNFSWGFGLHQELDSDASDGERERYAEDHKDDKPQNMAHFTHLKDIDLEIKKGEFVCIIGDVGSGKTNLLNALLGEMLYLREDMITEAGSEKHDVAHWRKYMD